MSATELEPRPLHVLLVEDNPDDALLLERHLRRNGFAPQLERVETAEEMLSVLDQPKTPELVLADYNLPNFSGPAALQLLKQSKHDIPFIMLSGAISEATAVESMRAGAQDYVTKQNLARLVPAVERELKEASARRNTLAAELALRASEDRFHRLVEAMPLGLLIADSSGMILYANGAAERLFDFSTVKGAPRTLGSFCERLVEPRSLLSSATLPTEPFEATCTTRTGQSVEVLVGVAVLNPDADLEQRQLAAFIADLTLQKRSEEMLRRTEKLAVAGRFAASIAHEINNPLEAITNLLYLLAHSELDASAREYLELAQTELDRVAQITIQTLRFYRRSTRASSTDVQELVRSVTSLFETRLRHLRVQVTTRFRALPPILIHDGEIRQVLANLVGNAIDALPEEGRLVLRGSAARHPVSGVAGIVVTVADNGTGMSDKTVARIFEPFFSTKGPTGTGLGLWVSQEIVEKHSGQMRVRSRTAGEHRPGGTVFRLFLPITSQATESTSTSS